MKAPALVGLLLLAGSTPLPAFGLRSGPRDVTVSTRKGSEPSRCEDIRILFGHSPAERAEETRTIAASASAPLRVTTAENSGARIWGADRKDFAVTLCKASADDADLSRIRLALSGNHLSVEGPDAEDWTGYLLIEAPRNAALEIEARNGEISLRGLSGRVTATAENGPISIKDCDGDIEARAENGPISLKGVGGRVRAHTQNGPIGVRLSGSAWNGAGLDASAVNGPLTLVIPTGYSTGTVVETSDHSPFQCRGAACAAARKDSDESGRRIELGSGPALVKLSTVNGPVSIRLNGNADEPEDED